MIKPPKPNQSNNFFSELFFALALLSLFFSIGGFFGINYYIGKRQEEYNNLDAQLRQEETPEQKELEKLVLDYKRRLQDYPAVLNNHISSSLFFGLLEKLVHPDVYLKEVTLNPMVKTVTINGESDSLESAGKQLLTLENGVEVFAKIDFSKLNLNDTGDLLFSLVGNINPEAITYKIEPKPEETDSVNAESENQD